MRLAYLICAMSVVGCRGDESPVSSAGSSGTVAPPETYAPPTCGGTSEGIGDATCAGCAESSCCTELEACATGTPCGDLLTCRSTCVDEACVETCRMRHAAGTGAAADYDACLGGRCGDDCPRNPGVCGTSFSTGDPPCDLCVDASCCAALSACREDATCAGCLEDFSESCASDAFFIELRSCLRSGCAASCDG